MHKHTPGPWVFYTEPQPNGCPIVGARGLMVCMLAHTVNQPEQRGEALANAALIAAAPDLLEMLDRAVRRLEAAHANGDTIMREWVVDARAVIAKATGVKHG